MHYFNKLQEFFDTHHYAGDIPDWDSYKVPSDDSDDEIEFGTLTESQRNTLSDMENYYLIHHFINGDILLEKDKNEYILDIDGKVYTSQ